MIYVFRFWRNRVQWNSTHQWQLCCVGAYHQVKKKWPAPLEASNRILKFELLGPKAQNISTMAAMASAKGFHGPCLSTMVPCSQSCNIRLQWKSWGGVSTKNLVHPVDWWGRGDCMRLFIQGVVILQYSCIENADIPLPWQWLAEPQPAFSVRLMRLQDLKDTEADWFRSVLEPHEPQYASECLQHPRTAPLPATSLKTNLKHHWFRFGGERYLSPQNAEKHKSMVVSPSFPYYLSCRDSSLP